MYEKLLLNSDGGVIPGSSKFKQANAAVVCIGLGGTGIDCLKNLKAKVYNRVQPDEDSSYPKYAHIKYLAVDTDPNGMVGFLAQNEKNQDTTSEISRLNADTEFFDISRKGIIDYFHSDAGKKELSNSSAYGDWLKNEDIKSKDTGNGASGVRQIGRYLLMEKAQKFVSRVESMVQEAMKVPEGAPTIDEVYVHIFSGLGGGTGAGTFLDVCYLVKRALANVGCFNKTFGYFFLPDVNLAKNLKSTTKSYIKVNGYASLQDLDYCMNFENNGDKWSQRYDEVGLIESEEGPVDLCHIIAAETTEGRHSMDAYTYAMNVATDYFMDFIVRTDDDFGIKSHISNHDSDLGRVPKPHGVLYGYCILGSASARIPIKEILTYLGASILKNFSPVKDQLPLDDEVEEYIKINHFDGASLFNRLTKNVVIPTIPDYDAHKAQEDGFVARWYDDQGRAVAKGMCRANMEAMTEDLSSFGPAEASVAGNAQSVINQVHQALRLLSQDIKKGPYYAQAVLRSKSGKGLIHIAKGFIETAQERKNSREYNRDEVGKKLKPAEELFKDKSKTNLFNIKKRYKEYCELAEAYVRFDAEAQQYGEMIQFLNKFILQLEDLDKKYSSKFTALLDEVFATFAENLAYLRSQSSDTDGYETYIVTLDDVRQKLDAEISSINTEVVFKDFISTLLSTESVNRWQASDRNGTSKIISDYFVELFNEYANKSMKDYLEEKTGIKDDPDRLAQNVRELIMNKLNSSAMPRFWSSIHYKESPAFRGYVTVPETCTAVVQAAKLLVEGQEGYDARPSDIYDRISVVKCSIGVPLYGYKGIEQYEQLSVGDAAYGRHLYEGKKYINSDGEQVTGRDWRWLPSPVPSSIMDKATNHQHLIEDAKKAKELYLQSESLGMIVDDGGRYIVNARDIDQNEIDTKFTDAVRSSDNEVKRMAKNELQVLIDEAPQVELFKISNESMEGETEDNKKLARIDRFVAAPSLQKLAEKEVAKRIYIDDLMQRLEPVIDEDLDAFLLAIFTGAITVDLPIVRVETKYEPIILSSPGMEFSVAPLYQGFLSYKSLLDHENKKDLADKADKQSKMHPAPESVISACAEVNKTFDASYRRQSDEIIRDKFPDQVGFLRDFVARAQKALEGFVFERGFKVE